MNKNDSMPSGKHDIGLAREVAAIDAKPEPSAVKQTTDQFFGLCVAAPDAGHHAASGGAVYNIDH
jgi:hypothetical protein